MMASGGQEVIIMLSDELAPQLVDLARHHHVWARKTSATEDVASGLWDAYPQAGNDEVRAGITLFSGVGTPEEDLLSIIDTVELHHGIGSSGRPAISLRVLGAYPTDAVREAMSTLGFTRVELIADGFVAHWQQ
jgi:hypothetical protein